MFEGTFHRGYLPLFGPVVILLLYIWLYSTLNDVIALRAAVLKGVRPGGEAPTPLTPVETHMLRRPLVHLAAPADTRWGRAWQWVGASGRLVEGRPAARRADRLLRRSANRLLRAAPPGQPRVYGGPGPRPDDGCRRMGRLPPDVGPGAGGPGHAVDLPAVANLGVPVRRGGPRRDGGGRIPTHRGGWQLGRGRKRRQAQTPLDRAMPYTVPEIGVRSEPAGLIASAILSSARAFPGSYTTTLSVPK